MMITIAIVLAVLWVLGMITSVTAGGLLHLLLVAAIIMVVVNLISGRNAV
ncbi:MAG: lmo0937 family membrane protein [Betaproteobacteria bacterium]